MLCNTNNTTNTNTEQVLGRYRVVRTLGSGILKVKLVYDPATGAQYAAKICKSSSKKASLQNEAALLHCLSKANIPNIIRPIEYIDRKQLAYNKPYPFDCNDSQNAPEYKYKCALIMELAANETLFDIIFHNGKMEEKLARTYFKKLVESVGTLHQKGFVHRDLKSENLLLDENFQLKVADFGFGREFNEFNKDKMKTKLGTDTYMAPELHLGNTYSGVKTDSFACGVLLFLFIFGRPPFFQALITDPYYRYLVSNKPGKFWKIYESKWQEGYKFDHSLKTLITDLLQFDPIDRVDVGETVDYEWMKGEVYTDDELVEVMRPLRAVVEQENKKNRS